MVFSISQDLSGGLKSRYIQAIGSFAKALTGWSYLNSPASIFGWEFQLY